MGTRISLVISGFLVAASTAAAGTVGGTTSVHVIYAAPALCPLQARFESAVRSRLDGLDPSSSMTISLAVAARDGGFESELAIERDGIAISRRTLADRSCEQLVDALALIAALAVTTAAEVAPAVTDHARASPRPVEVGIATGVYAGVEPLATVGGELFLGRELQVRGRPSLRIGVAAATSATMIESGYARFTWAAIALGACPFRLALGKASVAPCARIDLGALHASGSGIGQAQTSTRGWIAPSALLRLTWRSGRLALELEGGVLVPLERDRYYFPPATTIYQVPSVAVVGRAGVAVGF